MFVRAVQLLTQRNDGTIVVRCSRRAHHARIPLGLSAAADWLPAYLATMDPLSLALQTSKP